MFKPLELVALREVLDDYHATNRQLGHISVTDESNDTLRGFVYIAPTAMTDRTWHLWWIVVAPEFQKQGIGRALLLHAEELVRTHAGRMLLAETSSTPHYEPTRQYYAKHGYQRVACVPDYYATGDSLVVFCKRFDVR
jgi:ribosomal protein S18 acetylase RimI-like enzyme